MFQCFLMCSNLYNLTHTQVYLHESNTNQIRWNYGPLTRNIIPITWWTRCAWFSWRAWEKKYMFTTKILIWFVEPKRKYRWYKVLHECIYLFLNELVPEYLSHHFIRNSITCNTRRRSDLDLPKPKLSLGKQTFRYSGSVLFNILNIKCAQTHPSEVL